MYLESICSDLLIAVFINKPIDSYVPTYRQTDIHIHIYRHTDMHTYIIYIYIYIYLYIIYSLNIFERTFSTANTCFIWSRDTTLFSSSKILWLKAVVCNLDIVDL